MAEVQVHDVHAAPAHGHAPQHPYHLVAPSAWPIIGSIAAFVLAVGLIIWIRGGTWWIFAVGALGVAYTMVGWWRDVIREAEYEGHHTPVVQLHMRYGMMLFIASEVMFFVAWFWAYFDAALFPGEAHQVLRREFTGGVWPPTTKVSRRGAMSPRRAPSQVNGTPSRGTTGPQRRSTARWPASVAGE